MIRSSASGFFSAAVLSALLIAGPANAQKKYDVGATDTEIKIGNITPYSGPASAFSVYGKVQAAYFQMINDQGGVNGRKINFISYDDAYSAPKAVEQTRKLVENDEVLLMFSTVGTPSSVAVRKYLNAKKVPQLFVSTGASMFGDFQNFPWTIGLMPNYQSEARVYGKYILEHFPAGKIAVLYQHDDFGKDYLKGLKDQLGDKASMIIAEASYEVSEPTIDSQIVRLKASGADIFVILATPKFSAQAIRKAGEIGWTPTRFLSTAGAGIGAVLKPAGLDYSQGILSTDFRKDVTDARFKDDPGVKEWSAFLDKYIPGADKSDSSYVSGYIGAVALVQVLKQCGDDLTRENAMRQAANLKDFPVGVLIDGITINSGPNDYYPIKQFQMRRFKGTNWELFGPIMKTELGR